jgi:hypothetical protein
LTASAVVIACGLMYFLLRRELRAEMTRLRTELLQQIAAKPESAPKGQNGNGSTPHLNGGSLDEEIDPRVLSAAVSAMLGKEVRISPMNGGARPNGNGANHRWAHAGYIALQNSHDLALGKKSVNAAKASRLVGADEMKRNLA